jgi:hypothetical protein
MAREVRFLPFARLEAIDARAWYTQHSQRAADAFVTEMDRQLMRIAENAESFPFIAEGVRRVRLRRFPYSLLFKVDGDLCFVIACFHASRDPKVWRDRT